MNESETRAEYIDQQGIEPDVKVELTDADREAGRDPQMDKAMQLIGNLW